MFAGPRILVLDNLREGVLVPDVYDATLNPLYRDVLAHYGAVALPCRIQDPDRKGKVESAVGHAKNTPLKGQRFESLEQAQAYLDRWETNWAVNMAIQESQSPEVRVVCSYLNNLEQGQTETAHGTLRRRAEKAEDGPTWSASAN